MSSILKAYRISLHGTPAQEKHLRRFAGSLRWLWNKALATQKERPATGDKYASFGVKCNGPTEWRHAHAHAMDKAATAAVRANVATLKSPPLLCSVAGMR